MPRRPFMPGAANAAIHVWVFDLDAIVHPDALLAAVLAPDEIDHSSKALMPIERRRRLVCRAGLRWVLSRCVEIPPAALRFTIGAYGKPSLCQAVDEPTLYFNLSHSRGLAAIAVTDRAEVGIDIEHLAPLEPGLAESVLSPREQDAYHRLPDDARIAAFYRSWVRKEAILKATGLGLSLAPSQIEVPQGDEPTSTPLQLPRELGVPEDWTLRMLAPWRGVTGAVALRQRKTELKIHETGDFERLRDWADLQDQR